LRKPKNTPPSVRYSLNSGHRVLFDPALHDQKPANVLKIHEFFHSATRHNRLISWARITISWRAPLGAEEHVPDNSHSKHHKYQADRQEKQN
jgi:hypothetical protein